MGSTVKSVLTAVLDVNSNNVELAKLLNVSTRRIVSGKVKRELFNGIIEKEENKKITDYPSEKLQSLDESSIDKVSNNVMESEGINASVEKCKKKIFHTVLSPKDRKIRDDKLDLSVVRDFFHDICKLDTFASAKVYVHNYDGTYSYHHQVHVKSQSIKCYYDVLKCKRKRIL